MDKTKPSPTFQKAVSRHNKEQKKLEMSISWFIYAKFDMLLHFYLSLKLKFSMEAMNGIFTLQ